MAITEKKKGLKFVQVDMKLVEDKNLDAYDKAVYLALCKFADLNTGECYPSRNTISEFAGCKIDRTDKSIKHLVEGGYIIKKERKTKNGEAVYNTSNLYVLPYFVEKRKANNDSLLSDITPSKEESQSVSQTTSLVSQTTPIDETDTPSRSDQYELEPNIKNQYNQNQVTILANNYKRQAEIEREKELDEMFGEFLKEPYDENIDEDW